MVVYAIYRVQIVYTHKNLYNLISRNVVLFVEPSDDAESVTQSIMQVKDILAPCWGG